MDYAEMNSARSRIKLLLDGGSFVEIGGKVTARTTDFNMAKQETPGDGVITGYGIIDGNLVYVYSQDASVMNGSIGEMHAGKIARLYRLAMKMGAPVIGMLDSSGMRLQESADALQALGSIYTQMSLASGVIPQILLLSGKCGGGLSFLTSLADFAFAETGRASLFVNPPDTIPGNTKEKCDTSSVEYQMRESGLIDVQGSLEDMTDAIRDLICMLPSNNEDDASYDECTDTLNRLCPEAADQSEDGAGLLEMISDNGVFFEIKRDFARQVAAGFIRINGITVGAAANCSKRNIAGDTEAEIFDSRLTCEGLQKLSGFISFCDAFGIPVLTLTDTDGFKSDMQSEKCTAKEAGRLIYTLVNATVPKINLITRKAYGSAYTIMNSQSVGADIVYAWKDAEIGMMEPAKAAGIMYPDAGTDAVEEAAKRYKDLQMSSEAAARRGYVDELIDPSETRKYIISALEMLFTKREEHPSKKHGTV